MRAVALRLSHPGWAHSRAMLHATCHRVRTRARLSIECVELMPPSPRLAGAAKGKRNPGASLLSGTELTKKALLTGEAVAANSWSTRRQSEWPFSRRCAAPRIVSRHLQRRKCMHARKLLRSPSQSSQCTCSSGCQPVPRLSSASHCCSSSVMAASRHGRSIWAHWQPGIARSGVVEAPAAGSLLHCR